MQLDKMSVEIRPRSAWEGLDLGFTMARVWFRSLLGLWLVSAMPVFILLYVLLNENIFLFYLILWWLKPLYEPPLLFWLSRALFGEQLKIREAIRKWPSIIGPQLFANLTWRRLSPNRTFFHPVALLESLKGKTRRDRCQVLGRGQSAGAWLTIIGVHFEAVLQMCMLFLIFLFVPVELQSAEPLDFFLEPAPAEQKLQFACYFVAIAIFAPFYVAAGFALYLTRRTELEAWDIEIRFRRLQSRFAEKQNLYAAARAILLGLLCFLFVSPDPASAITPSHQESKQIIEDVLRHPDFGKEKTEAYWHFIGDQEKLEEPDQSTIEAIAKFFREMFSFLGDFASGLGIVTEALLWLLVGSLLAWLVYIVSKNAGWLSQGQRGSKTRSAPPSQLFGLELNPDSLPLDILAAVQTELAGGNFRAALSLLYRGVLIRLLHENQLEIPDSATEGECLRLVQEFRPQEEAGFFQRLTKIWLLMAYAHQSPQRQQLQRLCTEWQQLYEADSVE